MERMLNNTEVYGQRKITDADHEAQNMGVTIVNYPRWFRHERIEFIKTFLFAVMCDAFFLVLGIVMGIVLQQEMTSTAELTKIIFTK